MALYTVIQSDENFLKEKKCKNNKLIMHFRSFLSTYNVEILNSFKLFLNLNYNLKALNLQLKVS